MIHENSSDSDVSRLRAPELVAWLVSNTEALVSVATALSDRSDELSPGVSRERVFELCNTVRHSALEITVALLALLSRTERTPDDGALADAVANAHARLQQLDRGVPDGKGVVCHD